MEQYPTTIQLATKLRDWCKDPKSIFVQEFIIYEADMSEAEFEELADKDPELKRAYEYALSMEKYKITVGAASDQINANFAKSFLENRHGWSSGNNNVQKVNVFQKAAQEAADRANRISDDKPNRHLPDRTEESS